MKKSLSLFMALCLMLVILCSFSASAFAEGTVSVNGIDISAGGYWKNADTTEATGSETDYNFHYDAFSATLYLQDAVMSNAGIVADSALTLSVTGTNTVLSSGTGVSIGIDCEGDLAVNTAAGASLTVYGKTNAIYANGDASFTDGTVSAYGGIKASGNITLSGVDFYALVGHMYYGTASSCVAMDAAGMMTITDAADITAYAGYVYNGGSADLISAGIVTGAGLVVDGDSAVDARSSGASSYTAYQASSYGIYSPSTEDDVTISSGTVMASGGYNDQSSDVSYGIYCGKDLAVTGGEVNLSGFDNAVNVAGSFTGGTESTTMYYWNSDYGIFSGAGTEVMGTAVTSDSTHLLLTETNQTYYPVFANGVQFTAENATTGIPCGDGKAYLDVPEGNGAYTLTLDQAMLTSGVDMSDLDFNSYLFYNYEQGYTYDYLDAIYSYGVDLNIDLVGENSILSEEEQPLAEGIYVEDGGLTIDGNGTGSLNDDVALWSIGSDNQMLINNCTISASTSNAYSMVIYTNDDSMLIENADITADCAGYGAISSENDLTITDATITASCANGEAIGSDGVMKVDRSDISATADDNNGVNAYDIAFRNSKVAVSANGDNGIYAEGSLEMYYSDVDVTADLGYKAFYVGETATITGMVVTAAKAEGTDVAENELSNIAFNGDNDTFQYGESALNAVTFAYDLTIGDYADVENWSDWSKDYIYFAINNGLMIGIDDDPLYFAAYDTVTRGMMVQVIYHLEGSPEITADDIALYDDKFLDVAESAWYYDAVVWAANNGLVFGTDEDHFAPKENVTREQMVTFFWRYYGSPASSYDLSGYSDHDRISTYAQTAFSWAVENGIISGVAHDDNTITLSPKNSSTREQLTAVLARYCRNILTEQNWIDIGWML